MKKFTAYCNKPNGFVENSNRQELLDMARAKEVSDCRAGNHKVEQVKPGYTAYVGGTRVPSGTKFCSVCQRVLELPAGY